MGQSKFIDISCCLKMCFAEENESKSFFGGDEVS